MTYLVKYSLRSCTNVYTDQAKLLVSLLQKVILPLWAKLPSFSKAQRVAVNIELAPTGNSHAILSYDEQLYVYGTTFETVKICL